ncbi:outer membrane protein assembly factor BamB family protein [Halobaculum gomorrense]|uniref:outer membrane protein assembly factor BamB family protein n=1 Tax=Halobaculum gomorrense TaxID=43928 RepID=UPI001F15FCF7|nr:PQQ-binding-like beta-propeller repeat protein [Halobaculum gomorrense]
MAVLDDLVVVGTASGDLLGVDPSALASTPASDPGDDGADSTQAEPRWRLTGSEPVVTATPFDGGVLVGTRGSRGLVRLVDADGTERWRIDAAADIGSPVEETRFRYPFVAALATADGRAYAAARRYERRTEGGDADGSDRRFESVVYAVDPSGSVAWRHNARASPVALGTDGSRLAVAYNRCPEPPAHDDGLVVLDAATGAVDLRWDPRRDAGGAAEDATDTDRSVGDVALTPDGYAVASHADRHGYLLDRDGQVTAMLDAGATIECGVPEGGTDRVYAYPNHVVATEDRVVFVHGNTFPEEGRETAARHPAEHTAVGLAHDGTRRWQADVGGFAHHVDARAGRLAIPVAQHFRDRDPDVHGVRVVDIDDGAVRKRATAGVSTAVALDATVSTVAAVEEPVTYHDGAAAGHGAYRLHLWGL